MGSTLTITESLRAASRRLDTAAALARGALTCAEGGAEPEAVRMTLELDLEVYLSEAQTLLSAVTLLQRMNWKQEQGASDSS
ncbi:hypothetical protein VB618_11105 [Microvirga sp. CF3062]|uniref:hypothetical protein n=1 Tax=Microvirga sp. CF3062 TaxID=3110182 RepID=UPI002E7686B2|nr:hypothetical protein [Microvirga sp. CF3062]MEE1656747.1 hypothetical protein [Microvirga sp. CF3062]